jgi:hypothetical protein
MPGCPYCGEMHSQLYICEAMKQARANANHMAKVQPDVAKDMAKTVDTMAKVVDTPMAKTVAKKSTTTETSTYRYRDPVKRRAYKRALMRRRYAEQKP